MNPNHILQRVRELECADNRNVLWHLQSLALEGVLSEFAGRLDATFPDCRSKWLKSGNWSHYSTTLEALEKLPIPGGENHRLMAAAAELLKRDESANSKKFHATNIGREVWSTLDWCLEERRPCFIEGREGRGKSASARAWFEAHRGQARYVSLPGLGQQSDFFKALADAYGVNYSAAKAPNQIRWRVRDAIVHSGLVLVIDEAHFALPERHRNGRPPLIDWIDCDLCNAGVAVALISTPQFGPRLAEFEDRTKWNAGQFRRRFSGRWTALPSKTTESDLATLAQKALPRVGSKGITLAVGYAGAFDRDVSGLFDLVRDAQRRARTAGREEVSYQDLRDAYQLDRVPSENALAAAFKRSQYQQPDSPAAEDLPSPGNRTAAPLQSDRGLAIPEILPRRGVSAESLVSA